MSNGQNWIHSAGRFRVTEHQGGAASVFYIPPGKNPVHVHTFRMRDGANKTRAIRLADRRAKIDEVKP